MRLFKAEKRILEIWLHNFYLWYVSNNARHNHEHFLMLPSLLQTNVDYDPEIIAIVWRDFLMTNPNPPTDDESLLAMAYESKILKCSTRMFSPFYKLRGKNRRVKLQTFRNIKVQLTPKINDEGFHYHLLAYLSQICYTFGDIKKILKQNKGARKK